MAHVEPICKVMFTYTEISDKNSLKMVKWNFLLIDTCILHHNEVWCQNHEYSCSTPHTTSIYRLL